jgi:hypothetical protein
MSKTSRGRAKTPTVSRRPFTLPLFRRDDQKGSSSPLTSGVPEITSTDGRFATEDSAAAIRACRLQIPLVDRVVELRGRLETRDCDNGAETCNQRTDAAMPFPIDRLLADRRRGRKPSPAPPIHELFGSGPLVVVSPWFPRGVGLARRDSPRSTNYELISHEAESKPSASRSDSPMASKHSDRCWLRKWVRGFEPGGCGGFPSHRTRSTRDAAIT